MIAPLLLRTTVEVREAIAGRVRALRLAQGLKQSTLASKAGISVATLQRLERSGNAALDNLLRVAQALGRLDEFDALLRPPRAELLAELEAQISERGQRKRGHR